MDLYAFVTTGKSTQVIGRKTLLISGRGIYPVQDELPANVQKSILEMTCVLTKDGTTKITWSIRVFLSGMAFIFHEIKSSV